MAFFTMHDLLQKPALINNSNENKKAFLTSQKGFLFVHTGWSGKRDSNSRPQPWQGCALPTELFPHMYHFGGVDGTRTRDPRRDRPVF